MEENATTNSAEMTEKTKFYEGRIGMGILYVITVGFFGIGWFLDCIILLFKPNPYFVR